MSNDEGAQLYVRFKRWCSQPGALPDMSSALSPQQMIEEAMWLAYQAGHRDALILPPPTGPAGLDPLK